VVDIRFIEGVKVFMKNLATLKNHCQLLVALGLCCSLLSGCASVEKPLPNDPRFAPVQPTQLLPPPTDSGSLYQAHFSNNLWSDQRAKRVGDILTVVLEESTSSSKSANTSVSKDSAITIPEGTILGTTPSFGSGLPNSNTALSLSADLDSNRSFAGESDADQSNSLTGNITVTISQVLPNGMLVIRGEKWLTLTRGEEFIRITGLVRQADIRPDNTVLSTRVADARIAYSGTGELADANQMGWLSRFFNHPLWPF